MISNLKQSLRDKPCIFLHDSYPQVVWVRGVVQRLSRVEHYDSKTHHRNGGGLTEEITTKIGGNEVAVVNRINHCDTV